MIGLCLFDPLWLLWQTSLCTANQIDN